MLRAKALRFDIFYLLLVLGVVWPGSPSVAGQEMYEHLNLLGDIIDRVNSDYVEEVDPQKIVEDAINGILNGLDERSTYINAEQLQENQKASRRDIVGVGIELTKVNSIVRVVTPVENTPASRAGMQPGDLITHIDNKEIGGLTLSQVVDLLVGPVDTHVTLTINREGAPRPLDVTLIRQIIRYGTVTVSIIDDLVYIKIRDFGDNTSNELLEEVGPAKKSLGENLTGYVLDLRDNHGGLLDAAEAVADAFLAQGEILSVRGRVLEDSRRVQAKEGDIADGKRLVVLVNQNTAAGAEIVAGALQDHRRATVIGTKTFGHGSVQTFIPLGDRGALTLTTGRLYTPAGHMIDGHGIEPDITIPRNAENDNQLQRAVQVVQDQ